MNSLLKYLKRVMSPRYVVDKSKMSEADMWKLANAPSGTITALSHGASVQMLPMPHIHIHFNPRKPRRTAAMGSGLRRK